MRATNADAVAKEIQGYTEDVERRLRSMVAEFAYEAALAISANVPIGDATSLEMGLQNTDPKDPTVAYANYYKQRMSKWGIDTEVGFHKGALRYSGTGNFSLVRDIKDVDEMSNDIFNDASAYYEIGDTFHIGALGTAYDFLEANGSEQTEGQGIAAPSDESIAAIYKTDMKRFYDSAD